MAIMRKIMSILFPSSTPSTAKSSTPTFNPTSRTGVLAGPSYKDHLVDIFTDRQLLNSNDLLKKLIKFDPDVSAALNGLLTLANTEPVIVAKDLDEQIDREATKQVYQILRYLTRRIDYTQKFSLKPSLSTITENMRTMLILRGTIAVEVVTDKNLMPQELRLVDPASIEWVEKQPGKYKPTQKIPGRSDPLSLDLPNFFVSHFRRDPTSIYTYSCFVSAINTIAARQQVVNDLYRIMQLTGYPRISVKLLEEVFKNAAPGNVKSDPNELRKWLNDRIEEIRGAFQRIRPDEALIHFDSIEVSMINEKTPGLSLDISSIIDTLNAQNQAGLKTMSTIIGRGSSGVNTASVEARIAAMYADEINVPVAEMLSNCLSYIMHLNGYQGFVDVKFRFAEMRPELELEPQRVMKASRLKEDLSLGIITDDEYHIEMYGRIRPDSAPILSGTNFANPTKVSVDETRISPNSDPLGRSLAPEGSESARSNEIQK